MATTFHVTNFKNKTLDMMTGQSTSTTPIGFVNFYNGAQPADPSVAPGGAAEFASVSNGPNMSTRLSSAGAGITQLSTPTAPTTPSGAAGVASISFSRIYTTSSAPLIDTTATIAGGGGGIIVDSVTSVAATGTTVTAFSLKMPSSLGTVFLSQSLADRLADLWGGGSTTTPNMGNVTGGSSTLTIYSGAAPATADLPATGTVLVSYNMSGTNLWAAAVGGASGLNGAGPTALASGSGTASYYRLVKSNGTFTFTIQGSVGTAASDMLINTTAITAGVTNVQITDATISI